MERLAERTARRVWKTISRRGLKLLPWLSAEKKGELERRQRGKEEFRRLHNADFVIVSHPKSGRTWLRTMFSRYYQLRYGISERYILGFDNFHQMDARAPKVFFTHDTYVREFTGNKDSKVDFAEAKLVLMVRKPQDVAVSQFFQWKYRTRPSKKVLRGYPAHGSEISMFDFLMDDSIGLPHIVAYLNDWADALPQLNDACVVRYEDLRERCVEELGRVIDFVDGPAEMSLVKDAVEFASVANTRKLEEQRSLWMSGSRMRPGDRSNPDSYKVRRAVVGGYRDYFDEGQTAEIDAYVRERLSPVYGYSDDEPVSPLASVS